METNTVIIASRAADVTADAFVESFEALLQEHVLRRAHVTAEEPLQLCVLPNMRRLVVVAPTAAVARLVVDAFAAHGPPDREHMCAVGFSLLDTPRESAHLAVPAARRLLLVSPPQSPPPEFDFSRLEDGPHRPAQVPGQDLPPGQPVTVLAPPTGAKIVLHPCESLAGAASVEHVHTTLPPRSVFDDE
ncbi:ACL111Wp [Eremothecium gossypii ATCC 10895]|uniref:ACL111Wp n=1 Tax=Eremothecium gossypii (strain ATCC 10895 / CBS 109.51 / FGSC 9923 / NRRL Y-1056) TaxID=284811 RepID=Q75CN0_EREGS|nr:ACL111Wp [Eremothecium gossypii ATCC 10895]AAS51117.1 ACL111Wp [Eremothecium gossypii ATCC 10895]AEY95407.1 FACL111Wp [Eremothecium gossypii FDAG1]